MLSVRSVPADAGLSDDELAMRTRALATLLDVAARGHPNDALAGYRDLLRETLDAARASHGAQAALALLVDELVRALDDPAQVAWLMDRLREASERR